MTLETGVKELAEAVGADVKALADGKVNSNDPRLTDSREWSATTVTQAEAESGTASTRRAWTAQRVRQAINAWWQLVTSGFGRNLVAASNEQAARNVLQLGTAATRNVGVSAGNAMEVGAGGWILTPTPDIGFDFNSINYTGAVSPTLGTNAVNCPYSSWGTLQTWVGHTYGQLGQLYISNAPGSDADQVRAHIRTRPANSNEFLAWEELHHTGNTLNIGKTAASARIALQLTGEWVDLRPYLKSGFYFDSVRNGRNSYPRIRKLSCGRVELDGIVSFNETSGTVPIDVFVNVPAEFRPTLTVGGLMFGDTASPLSFGSCNWLVMGEVEYSPPRVHGDIMMMPLTLASPAQGGALSLNGIYWFT